MGHLKRYSLFPNVSLVFLEQISAYILFGSVKDTGNIFHSTKYKPVGKHLIQKNYFKNATNISKHTVYHCENVKLKKGKKQTLKKFSCEYLS